QLVDDVGCSRQPGEVEVADLRPPAEPPHLLRGGVARLLVAVPRDTEIAALLGERDSGGPADARLRPGDDRDAGLPRGHGPTLRAVHRARRPAPGMRGTGSDLPRSREDSVTPPGRTPAWQRTSTPHSPPATSRPPSERSCARPRP